MIEQRISLTAGPQSVAIGVDKTHIRAWLDAGSPRAAVSVAGPASNGSPVIDDGIVWSWDDPRGGVADLHVLASSAHGTLNVKAW